MPKLSGHLRKLRTAHEPKTNAVHYSLALDDTDATALALNPLVGGTLRFRHTGEIHCVSCGRRIKKTYSQGYCYPCCQTLAECDMCILKPQLCHFHAGTCRDEEFGKRHCFQAHTLYLARSSGIKIGITRSIQQTTRWMDQGAVAARVLGSFPDRLQVGLAEEKIAAVMRDKTDWRKMLRNEISDEPFAPFVKTVREVLSTEVEFLHEDNAAEEFSFVYPVREYPLKVKSVKLDKQPEIGGTLLGIKGQYLIFADCVMNLRAHAGYEVEVEYADGGEE